MAVTRTANAVWEHDLLRGRGEVQGTSGGLPKVAVSWSSRTEASAGKSSPEELLAAAQAACFSMALSAGLAKMERPPERIEVGAACTFDKVGDKWTVVSMDLTVGAKAASLTDAQLGEAAKAASEGCPISRALHGNVAIRIASARVL